MSEFAERERVPAKPVLARSIIDDVKDWWNGPQPTARLVKPEVPMTKQDFTQVLSLVSPPLSAAQYELEGKPDRLKCASAGAKLGPAASALQVIASHKKEAGNQAALLAAVPDIEAAQTTLKVLGDVLAAPAIWIAAFTQALAAVDTTLAAPVIDPDAAKDAENADPPPADGVFKRDHDLLESSVKPTVQRLIEVASGEPFVTWRPDEFTEADLALSALGGVQAKQLAPAKAAVEKGKLAIAAYAGDVEKSIANAKGKIESAQQKLSAAMNPYFESNPRDPDSPSYNPDLPPEEKPTP